MDMHSDPVDEVLAQWARERPELDVSGMSIIARVSRLERAIRPLLETVFSRHGLESWEFDVLATLLRSGAPHQLTPGELLDSMMITSGAMTNRLDRLEERGFVTRAKDSADGRRVLVQLTEKGLATVDEALSEHATNEAHLVSGLGAADREQLVALLRALGESLGAEAQS